MGRKEVELGIQAIQAGQFNEGARLLRIALKDENLTGHIRAMALLWLAETTPNNQSKLNYYQEALQADPQNTHVQQRLDLLMTADLPPTPPIPNAQKPPTSTPPPPIELPSSQPPIQQVTQPPQASPPPAPFPPRPRTSPNALYRTVGIIGGRNGRGTGFFINKEGVVVTTRHVVTGESVVLAQLDEAHEVEARVLRAYAEYDVVFIATDFTIQHLLTPITTPHLPDHSTLVAYSHYGKPVTGKRRATKNEMKPYWIPTTIETLPDAGGLPLFNDANMLVGMLTQNSNRTTDYRFGIHIHHIYYLWEQTQQAMQVDPNTTYCSACGGRSRAPMVKGGFYCEACGAILPYAQDDRRSPTPEMAWLLGENQTVACEHCMARVGFYDDNCLRCGAKRKKQGRR